MSSLNKVCLIGRLGQDPETKYTQSNTAVCNFSLATSEKFKDSNGANQERTEWHRVVVWDKLAEICQKYLTKGSLIYIEGSIQTKQWEDKEGNKRYTTEIKGYSMQMLDSKGNSEPTQQKPSIELSSDFDDMDDNLPFVWLILLVPSIATAFNLISI